MNETELYKRADEMIGTYLTQKGFRITQPGEYVRRGSAGEDRILVSRAAGSKSTTHFGVFLSYYPDYLEPVFSMFNVSTQEKGFPCGPYLTPVGASRAPKYWSWKDSIALDRSLSHVLDCLDRAGLPWLESLRDPKVFAANVDSMAALVAGLANEVAGNVQRAVELYSEMLRRLRTIIDSSPDEAYLRSRVAKPFVFVAKKLGAEQEQMVAFQRMLNYYPDIKPVVC